MKVYDKIWQKRYDVQVFKGRYDHQKMWYHSLRQQEDHKSAVFDLMKKIGLAEHSVILEAGCGTGFYIREIEKLQQGHMVIGIDVSSNMLRETGKIRREGNHLLAQGILEALPFMNNAVDMVLSMSVLQTVGNYKKSLTEICRIIKPGGYLILATLRQYSSWELVFLFPWMFITESLNGVNAKNIFDLAKNRDKLVWQELPPGYPPQRYIYSDIKNILKNNNMSQVKCYFPGKARKIPLLMNSFFMIVLAKKEGELNNNRP